MAEGFMPAGFDIRGSSQGHVELSAAEGGTSFTGQVRTSAGSLAYSQTGAKEAAELAYVFRGIEAGATIDKDGLKSRLDVRMGKEKGLDEQFLRGTFEVPGMRIPAVADPGSLQIKGSLKARFADLDLIEAFVPELSGVAGVFTANIAAGGTASEPRASGRMSLTEGTVKLVTPGITLEQIDFTADFDPGRKIRVKGSAASGKGTLSAEGVLTLDAEQGWPVDLKLAGDSFESARTPYIHVLVSPELDINYQSGKVQVNGTVLVPEASVEPAEYVTASAPSSDVTVKGRQAATVQARPVEVQADVTVILGEKITFKGYGLTGRISGSIDVTERPGEPTTAAGELQVNDGEYRAFGRTLTIERGRLIFTGGQIDNPGLDVRAVRVVRGVTAGVQVSGTLISPVLTLISEPVMEESEILSYLVLGRPLDQASSEDAQDLSSAATAVSLAGGLAIAKEIGQRFGIEEVRIETGEETEDSTLVVGKYLSPRVYVQYGVGLFQSISVFRFGYQLSKRFLLEGESGVDSGADLIFSIDRK
jgi:translocation and assembly module TamB